MEDGSEQALERLFASLGPFFLVMTPIAWVGAVIPWLRAPHVRGFILGVEMVLIVWVDNILYKALILSKHRDLLQRILEERQRTPASDPSVFSIHLIRPWMALISYCLLFVVAPFVLVCFAGRYGVEALVVSLLVLFVFLAVSESGFRIWRRLWRIA